MRGCPASLRSRPARPRSAPTWSRRTRGSAPGSSGCWSSRASSPATPRTRTWRWWISRRARSSPRCRCRWWCWSIPARDRRSFSRRGPRRCSRGAARPTGCARPSSAPGSGSWWSTRRWRAAHVPLVGALLDAAGDAPPVRLVGVVARLQLVELEPRRRVARALLVERLEEPVEVLARHQGLDPLDALEVLLVERLEALELHLGVVEQNVEVFDFHRSGAGPRSG